MKGLTSVITVWRQHTREYVDYILPGMLCRAVARVLRVRSPVRPVLEGVAADDGRLARPVGIHGHERGAVRPVRVHDLRPVRRPRRVVAVVELEVGEVVSDVADRWAVDDPR